jgi:hypothetical protein
MNRVKNERTEDLAREVLHDLKCLEHCEYQCAWFAADPLAQRDTRVPGIVLKFDYPQAHVQPALAILVVTQGFANGTPLHDAKIKYVIRQKVENYLKMIGIESGINTPQEMRLTEEEYA